MCVEIGKIDGSMVDAEADATGAVLKAGLLELPEDTVLSFSGVGH